MTLTTSLRRVLLGLTGALALAACGAEPERFATPEPAPAARISVPYRAVLLREVSLPTYAASEEISIADPAGRLTGSTENLWADDPVRAVTLGLARAMAASTGARVAPEPWPFVSRPEVAVDLRLEVFLPDSAGRFTAKGMYFVAPEEEGRPERARSFEIVQAYDPEGGYPAIAAARAALVTRLAAEVAQNGLR